MLGNAREAPLTVLLRLDSDLAAHGSAAGVGRLVVVLPITTLDPGSGRELVAGVANLGVLVNQAITAAVVLDEVGHGAAALKLAEVPFLVVTHGKPLVRLGARVRVTPGARAARETAGLPPARGRPTAEVEGKGVTGELGTAGVQSPTPGGGHELVHVLADVPHVGAVVHENRQVVRGDVYHLLWDIAPGWLPSSPSGQRKRSGSRP